MFHALIEFVFINILFVMIINFICHNYIMYKYKLCIFLNVCLFIIFNTIYLG